MKKILIMYPGNLLLLILIWIFLPPQGAEGGEKEFMKPEISFSAEVRGWKWDGQIKHFNSRMLFDYMNGAAELYLAYGVQSLDVYQWERSGHPSLTMEIYKMESPADAYGIFSFERQDEDAGIGQGSEFGGGMLRFWQGPYFVSLYGEGEGPDLKAAILHLGKEVAQSISQSGAPPRLIHALPDAKLGLIPKSIRFVRSHVLLNQRYFIANQNILHLSRQTEAVIAQYMRGSQMVHVLLIRYAAGKQAEAAIQSFKKAYMPEAGAKGSLRTEDGKWTMAQRQGEFVFAVFGAPAPADAEELIKAAEVRLREKGP